MNTLNTTELMRLIIQELARTIADPNYVGSDEWEKNDLTIYDNLPYDPEKDQHAMEYTARATHEEIHLYNLGRCIDKLENKAA